MTRREWCAVVAKLVSPAFPGEATQALIDMLPAFRHFPEQLFTSETAIEVAMAKRRQSIPAFDEIAGVLNEHRRQFLHEPRPALPAPPPEPERQPPTEAEIEAVADLVRQFKTGLADGARERDRLFPEAVRSIRPMADVTMKGEELRRSRQARGCNVPVAS